MRLGHLTHPGKVRDINEDSYYVSDSILIVADGMGGHKAGEVASKLALESFLKAMDDMDSLPDSLVDSFQKSNEAVYNAAQAPELQGMGTTLTTLIYKNDTVYVGHVGDSRAYLVRQDQLVPLTIDHSVVNELVRSGNISPEDAKHHPHRNLITRALGTESTVAVDVQVKAAEPGDGFLLCSDGLTVVIDDWEILSVITSYDDPMIAAQELVNLANARGGPDNITVIVAWV